MIFTNTPPRGLAGLLLAALLLACSPSAGWAADILWTGTVGDDNWNTAANWTGGFVPEAQFEEVGVVDNGDTAFIDANLPNGTPNAAGLVLGQMAGNFGGLEVRSGGSINFVASSGMPDGTANIGLGGVGTLAVRRGGSMSTTLLDVNPGSTVLVGTDAGAGVASLTSTGGMFLNGTTTVRGAGHTFSAAGNVTFEGSSTLVAQITSTSHSPIQSAGAAAVDGGFKLEFGDGFMPSSGNAWSIVDATAISGTFDSIDLTAVPAPGPGRAYQFANVPGGTNGRLLQLKLNTLLQLTVNADTGAVSVSSPSGTAINVTGYSILSGSGLLSVGEWNSLQDQGVPNWFEATPTASALNELNAAVGGSLSIGTTPVGLGTPYNLPATFGQAPDVQFEYYTSTGDIVQGLVEYTGIATANNLELTVDPATGAGRLRNSSNLTLSLVGYSVLSDSGSLLPNNGDWSSLDDQNLGDWREANPTANALNEFIEGLGTTTLNPGQTLQLGELFQTGGTRDLALEFALDGELVPRPGSVRYAAFAIGLPGDFNQDGKVDAADYVVWRKNGTNPIPNDNGLTTAAARFALWRANFGNMAGSGSTTAAAGVPEPVSWSLMLVGIVGVMAMWRKTRQ
jgi:hypothetical protein